MRQRAFACAVLAAIGLGCTTPQADRPVLRVGTSGDYAPFSSRDRAADLEGFDIEVAQAFAHDRGYTIEWVPFVWAELAKDFQGGRFDVAMSGVTVRVDRSVLGRFSVPVVTSGAIVMFARERFPAPGPASFEDLDREGVTIAVNRGGHLERVARAMTRHASVETRPLNDSVRQALFAGEVDAVVTDILEAPHWSAGKEDVVGFTETLTRDRKAYWVSPDRPALSRELDRWLLDREATGDLARLRARWFGTEGSPDRPTPASALESAIAERLSLMPPVAEFKRGMGLPIEDRAREARVLDAAVSAVERAARERAVAVPDREVVRRFYRAQIEAAKALQRRVLATASPSDPATPRYDLAEAIRPALLRIGDRMAMLIVESVVRAADGEEIDRAAIASLRSTLADAEIETELVDEVISSFLALGSAGVVESQ